MDIHEYQAKALLKSYGLPLLPGFVARSPEEAVRVARERGSGPWVVKAQIHAGGRGKVGGVKIARTPEEVRALADSLLDKPLVTHQTGPEGQIVRALYIEDATTLQAELYLSFTLDRSRGCVAIIASAAGGMEIEEVAAKDPASIHRLWMNSQTGYMPFYGRDVAYQGLKLEGDLAREAVTLVERAYKAFVETDAVLLELNPLVVTGEGHLLLLDAKMTFDDNALYRHPEITALRDVAAEDPAEVAAQAAGLSYIRLDGNIGCLVNGAGLAMATMDSIQYYGGKPANFLDVGGGAPKERVIKAFQLILSDPNVQGILVNIFGGIMRCDIIAAGIVEAVQEMALEVPLVVRLAGTNFEEGKNILADSGLRITAAASLDEAAKAIVDAVQEVR